MKTILCIISASVAVAVCGQTNTLLTNDVVIGNRNLSFSIEDYGNTNGAREVFSDSRLSWVLHNPTEKYSRVHSEGLERTFSLKLFDNQGHEMSLTDYGKGMNSGPFPLPKTGSIHFIGLPPGDVSVRDFSSIDKLFQIPKPGDYTFEARYWYIEIGPGQWKLSDPVRLTVIKRPDKNANVGMTNAPSQ